MTSPLQAAIESGIQSFFSMQETAVDDIDFSAPIRGEGSFMRLLYEAADPERNPQTDWNLVSQLAIVVACAAARENKSSVGDVVKTATAIWNRTAVREK
jgi:hypothetical protein